MWYEPRIIPYVEPPEHLLRQAHFPEEKTNSSQSIKTLLAGCTQTRIQDWKRGKKITAADGTLRAFDHAPSQRRALVEVTPVHGTHISFYTIPTEIEVALIEVANQVTHCGDYGQLFWNPLTLSVCLVLGDCDPFDPDPETIIGSFLAVPGVKAAELSDETFPFEEETGPGDWVNLGIRGKPSERELEAVEVLAKHGYTNPRQIQNLQAFAQKQRADEPEASPNEDVPPRTRCIDEDEL